MSKRKFAWSPQPGPQADAIAATWCDELFFGGSRGGGKSDYLLGDFVQDICKYQKFWNGIIFRKTYDELEELLKRAGEIYPQMGGLWIAGKRTWVFPTGSTLKFRFLERDQDAERYQGHQYSWLGFDEITNWNTPHSYDKLKACLRSAKKYITTKRIRCSGNPGGPGHHWIKSRFIDPAPLGYEPIDDPETKMTRMFIPSRVQDNKLLMLSDPTYIHRLKASGSEALVRAWLEGDWNSVVGAFFTERLSIIEPFDIPWHWLRFGAFDWGSAAPFCFGWYAVSDGDHPDYPKGALIKYREFYGASGPNVGLKWTAEEVADKILMMTGSHEKLTYVVADPSIFKMDGGPSIAETMRRRGLAMRPGDNSRMAGWAALRARLVGEEGKPMLYFFKTCVDTIRTLPAVQHDVIRPEDIDTEGEDHAVDETRYAVMSRPWVKNAPKQTSQMRGHTQMTLHELIEKEEQYNRQRRHR